MKFVRSKKSYFNEVNRILFSFLTHKNKKYLVFFDLKIINIFSKVKKLNLYNTNFVVSLKTHWAKD